MVRSMSTEHERPLARAICFCFDQHDTRILGKRKKEGGRHVVTVRVGGWAESACLRFEAWTGWDTLPYLASHRPAGGNGAAVSSIGH